VYNIHVQFTGASSYLSSYPPSNGVVGGLVPPLGRGGIQYQAPAAPSEASVGSSSFSYASVAGAGRGGLEGGVMHPVGRGSGLVRGQTVIQNAGPGKYCSVMYFRNGLLTLVILQVAGRVSHPPDNLQ